MDINTSFQNPSMSIDNVSQNNLSDENIKMFIDSSVNNGQKLDEIKDGIISLLGELTEIKKDISSLINKETIDAPVVTSEESIDNEVPSEEQTVEPIVEQEVTESIPTVDISEEPKIEPVMPTPEISVGDEQMPEVSLPSLDSVVTEPITPDVGLDVNPVTPEPVSTEQVTPVVQENNSEIVQPDIASVSNPVNEVNPVVDESPSVVTAPNGDVLGAPAPVATPATPSSEVPEVAVPQMSETPAPVAENQMTKVLTPEFNTVAPQAPVMNVETPVVTPEITTAPNGDVLGTPAPVEAPGTPSSVDKNVEKIDINLPDNVQTADPRHRSVAIDMNTHNNLLQQKKENDFISIESMLNNTQNNNDISLKLAA